MSCESSIAIPWFLFFGLQPTAEWLFNVHVVFVFLIVEYFLQFNFRFNKKLNENAFWERVDSRNFLIHGQVEASASATDYENFVILLWNKAIINIRIGNIAMMEWGMRYFSDLREEAVVVIDF